MLLAVAFDFWSSKRHITARTVTAAVTSIIIALATGSGQAEEKDPRPAAGIQDSSFLIEEAYNQEAGVVQHINL